jgi:hypothetical protein
MKHLILPFCLAQLVVSCTLPSSKIQTTPRPAEIRMAMDAPAEATAMAGDSMLVTTQSARVPTKFNGKLPLSVAFKGDAKFQALVSRAQKEKWANLPIGERTATVGKALAGTSYVNYTLELSNSVECPCANMHAMDCWTFYETSLAFARMIKSQSAPYTPADMLKYIEMERYRNGRCDGTYLSRMHHLEEVFANNQSRGLGRNISRELGGVKISRNITEMQHAWKSYRALVANPSYRTGIAKVEQRVSALPVYYIPRSKVRGIESSLRSGDIIAIVSADKSGYTSHVGMAVRDGSRCRFLHATSRKDKGRCVHFDSYIPNYLAESSDHIGIIVFRPGEAPIEAPAGTLAMKRN